MVNVKAFHRKLHGMKYRLSMIIRKERDPFSEDSRRAYSVKVAINEAITMIERYFPEENLKNIYPL